MAKLPLTIGIRFSRILLGNLEVKYAATFHNPFLKKLFDVSTIVDTVLGVFGSKSDLI